MPRFRLPRVSFASLRNRAPSDERLVLIAQVAGFVVLIGVIATFVLIASANAGEGVAVKQPPIPTITNVDEPAPTTTTERPPPPVIGTARPTVSQEAVVKPAPKPKPKPKPKPPKPAPPAPPTNNPPPNPGPGGPPTADPFDRCAPEGAHAVTRHRHIPLVCHDGRWHFEDFDR